MLKLKEFNGNGLNIVVVSCGGKKMFGFFEFGSETKGWTGKKNEISPFSISSE